ncbi:T9SS type A sorting domain-containing protein [Ferruginibacter sp. SUN106]|uniref:T9SS type A sorting domain-containing protein n=1 Tax=Ferruginibacter sp. SUN106 TaxID=2978348 RepID=UPI003D360FC4
MKKFLLNSKSFVITLVFANLFFISNLKAQTNTWDGSSSTAWATGANWSLNHAPLAAEDVVIPIGTAGTNWPNLAASTTIKSLTTLGRDASGGARGGNLTISTNGITLTITGNLTINGATGGTTESTLTGITLTGTTSSLTVNGNITATNGTTTEQPEITLGTGTLTVGGNITIGTTVGYTVSNGNVVLNGTTQAITSPAATYKNLTISGGGTKTLSANTTTLTGILTLNSGILTIPAAATPNLILNASPANAIAGTFGATTHIKAATSGANSGLIRVNNITVSSAYTFPVGDGTNYLPVQLTSSNTLANNSFSVGVFDGVTANGAPNGTAFTAAQKLKIVDAVWIVNYNGTGTPTAPLGVNMKLDWVTSLEGTSFTANPNALVGIAHYGPSWGTCQQTSANNGTNTVTLNGITTFSPFAVGTINAGGAPLPIKIYYFNASKGNVANTLNWNAECTSSQATFEIERSADGKNFTTINSFTATQARCALPFSYDDAAPLTGTNFYRIKIIDIDGRINYTSIVKVGAQVRDMQLAGILPNPVSNTAQLSITTSKKDKVELAIVSLEGKVVYRNTVQVQSGSSLVSLDVSNLATGTYFVRGVFSDGQTNSVKFVKQ